MIAHILHVPLVEKAPAVIVTPHLDRPPEIPLLRLCNRSTSEEKHAEERQWRLQDGVQWILQDLSLQAAKGSWREAGETTCRALPCSVSGQLKAWETLSALLPASSKSKWCVEVNHHDWIPPCSRESHPRSAMPTFSSHPPPPPRPPCTNLNFHCVFHPIFFSLQFLPIPTVLLLLLLPSRESMWLLIVCIVTMKLCVSVLCCQVIQPDLHMVATWRTTAIHGW